MDIFRIVAIAVLTTFTVLLVKPAKPEAAMFVGLAGGLLVILMFVESLQGIIGNMDNLVERTGVQRNLFSALIRIIGIGYLTEFASSICQDAGNESMAKKVTLAGKVLILVMALPIINNLVEIVIGILP